MPHKIESIKPNKKPTKKNGVGCKEKDHVKKIWTHPCFECGIMFSRQDEFERHRSALHDPLLKKQTDQENYLNPKNPIKDEKFEKEKNQPENSYRLCDQCGMAFSMVGETGHYGRHVIEHDLIMLLKALHDFENAEVQKHEKLQHQSLPESKLENITLPKMIEYVPVVKSDQNRDKNKQSPTKSIDKISIDSSNINITPVVTRNRCQSLQKNPILDLKSNIEEDGINDNDEKSKIEKLPAGNLIKSPSKKRDTRPSLKLKLRAIGGNSQKQANIGQKPILSKKDKKKRNIARKRQINAIMSMVKQNKLDDAAEKETDDQEKSVRHEGQSSAISVINGSVSNSPAVQDDSDDSTADEQSLLAIKLQQIGGENSKDSNEIDDSENLTLAQEKQLLQSIKNEKDIEETEKPILAINIGKESEQIQEPIGDVIVITPKNEKRKRQSIDNDVVKSESIPEKKKSKFDEDQAEQKPEPENNSSVIQTRLRCRKKAELPKPILEKKSKSIDNVKPSSTLQPQTPSLLLSNVCPYCEQQCKRPWLLIEHLVEEHKSLLINLCVETGPGCVENFDEMKQTNICHYCTRKIDFESSSANEMSKTTSTLLMHLLKSHKDKLFVCPQTAQSSEIRFEVLSMIGGESKKFNIKMCVRPRPQAGR